jgi:hypothetical protein
MARSNTLKLGSNYNREESASCRPPTDSNAIENAGTVMSCRNESKNHAPKKKSRGKRYPLIVYHVQKKKRKEEQNIKRCRIQVSWRRKMRG